MGRGRLIVAAAVLLLAAMPIGPATGAATAPHAAVFIDGNAGFTAANGVIAGTGTSADPYVIAGWHFSSSIGTALIIRNVTAAVVIRDNEFSGQTGLSITNAVSATVVNNTFYVRTQGALITNVTANVTGNDFVKYGEGSAGVTLNAATSVVADNRFTFIANAIVVWRGTANVTHNDIHLANVGISFRSSVDACATANTITDTNLGVRVEGTIGTCLHGNVDVNGHMGIFLTTSKDVDVVNNTIRGAVDVGVMIESSSGNFSFNVVVDGGGDAVQIWHSPFNLTANVIENNLGIGLHFMMAEANATANLMANNGVGITIADAAVVHLTSNIMVNNTVGMNVPYVARQSIFWMQGNFVNGVNVDGTVVASDKVFFYHASNVALTGGVRDSGFSAGYYGSLTAQGNLVLYEVDTATVTGTVISHANVGVTAVNAFNVVIEGASIIQTGVGVQAQAVVTGFQVPACVVSVKNTTITIPVDPPATIGIDVKGSCLVNVRGTNISVVDTGIRLDASVRGNISASTISGTDIGLEISAKANIVVRGNNITDNRIGARFTGSAAVVTDNQIRGNAAAGVILALGSTLTFEHNTVTTNGEGVIDATSCGGSLLVPSVCSTFSTNANVVTANRGDGIRINGSSSLRGDVLVGNVGNGARLASATIVNVTANGNMADGASSTGNFVVRGSTFSGNVGNGLTLRGSGDLDRSSFTFNGRAGLRVTAVYVTSAHLNVSFNFDGIVFDELVPTIPSLTVPTVGLNGVLNAVPGTQQDPMDIHRSILFANERDAIRAGAAVVNATHNWWGGGMPVTDVAEVIGAFQNGVTPGVRVIPYYTDYAMTTTGPIPGL